MTNIRVDKGADLLDMADLSDESARLMLEKLRWPDGAYCPRCKGKNVVLIRGQRPGLWRCRACPKRPQFTVTVGTIFESSHIPLRKWVMCFHIMCASKKGVSALQIKRMLGLSYQSAWFMC